MSDQFTRYEDPTGYGTPQTPEEPVKLNPWAAVFTVLWAPRQVFALVRQRAPIAAPYVASMVVSLIGGIIGALNMSRFSDQIMQQALQNAPQTAQGQQAAQMGMTIAKAGAWGGAIFGGLAGPWLAGLFFALILMLFGLALRPVRPTFAQYFSATGYIRVPLLVASILTWPLIYTVSTYQGLQNIGRALSLAALVPNASPFVQGLLSTIAPFMIWEYVLMVIALAVLHRKREGQTAWVGVVLWCLGAIIVAGFSALGASFQNLSKQMQPPKK